MRTSDEHVDIDGYIVGDLDADRARAVEAHLDECPECREEVHTLRELQEFLVTVPPEALLDGPPDDADLLLQRTLRQVRTERSGTSGRRTRWAAAASAVVAAAAVCVGVIVGRATVDAQQVIPAPPASPPAAGATEVPGTRFASAVNPSTGARLTVRVVPAAGWVRINAAVTGIPAGQRCYLVVVGRDGHREMAGSWLVSEAIAHQGVNLNGSALVDPAQVASVVVENASGQQFVTANV
jgi:predicted anti-sigma-YlaC factor YlaD